MATTIYPVTYPCPMISGYSADIGAGLVRTSFEAGNSRQRRIHKLMPHLFSLTFIMPQATYGQWLRWVNDNGYSWFKIDLASALAGILNRDTAEHTIRFASDLQTEIVQTGEGFWWQIKVTAEWLDFYQETSNASVIPPAAVTGFQTDVRDLDRVVLLWDESPDPLAASYEIRFTPRTDVDVVWATGSVIATGVLPDVTSYTAGLASGTYMIAAVSPSGVYSPAVFSCVLGATFSSTFNGTIVDALHPGFAGTFSDADLVTIGSEDFVQITPPATLGTWTSSLVRTCSNGKQVNVSIGFEAEPVKLDDVIANWVPIAVAAPLAGAVVAPGDWEAYLDFGSSLTSGGALSYTNLTGNPATSSGSFAKWGVRFRLDAQLAGLNVRLKEVTLTSTYQADEQSLDNQALAPAGSTLTFPDTFAGTPSIVAYAQNCNRGEVLTLTNTTASSVTARVTLGGSGVARTVDIQANGFGII